jgi:hypothetical protein
MNHSYTDEWIPSPSPDGCPCGVLVARHALLFTDRPKPGSTNGEARGASRPASRWLLELLDEEDDRVCVLIADGGDR